MSLRHSFAYRTGWLALLALFALLAGALPGAGAPAQAAGRAAPEPPLLPVPATPSNHGAHFQMICPLGPRRHDDPIVFPGQAGMAHEHQFFANTAADANATYARLIASPTTCRDAVDTAAYWAPTLYDAQGVLRSPRRVRAYYYANTRDPAALQAFPPNLRMIAGDARADGPQPRGAIEWTCRNRQDQAAHRPLAQQTPPRCRRTEYLSLTVRFPDCWDGVHLDSSDHRRHMAYANDQLRCPASHPVKVPKLRLSIVYEDRAFTGGAFTLGGPAGDAHALPWYAMHADFWNTWQQDALRDLVTGCLQQGRSARGIPCSR